MSVYTVHQFYFSVNNLLEKYNAKKPDFALRVNFQIEDSKSGLAASFYVSYGLKNAKPEDRIFAVSSSPATTLQKLEEELQALSKNSLINNIGIEIPEPAEQGTINS